MKKLQPSTQYRKDLKRYKNNPKKLEEMKEVLGMLISNCFGLAGMRAQSIFRAHPNL